MDPEAPKQADEDEFENSNEQDSGSPQLLDDDDSSDRAVAPEPQELSDEVPDEASDQKTSTGLHAIFDGALVRGTQRASARFPLSAIAPWLSCIQMVYNFG